MSAVRKASQRHDGKALEQAVHAMLSAHLEKRKSFFHRFADTRAAGGRQVIAAQPGDFVWLLPRAAVLVEAKSTDTGAPLLDLIRTSKTSRHQLGKHRLWHIAGHPSIYIWGDLLTRRVEVFDGKSVIAAYSEKDKGLLQRVAIASLDSMDVLSSLLEGRYQ